MIWFPFVVLDVSIDRLWSMIAALCRLGIASTFILNHELFLCCFLPWLIPSRNFL
jgi:hypothetical protein